MNQNNENNRTEGFTIVEIIVVVFMFSAAIITMSSLFSYIQYAQRDVQYLDIATRAARTQIEHIRNSKYSTLNPGTPISFTADLPASLPYGATGAVTVSNANGMSGIKKIDAKVEWPVGSITKSTTLTALVGASGLTE